MSDFLKVNMNEYLPLRDVVFNTLRQGILKGELEPGERLMEVQLANRLGVSRTPIREAIRKLELEGLVVMIPRKGAEVAKISEKNLELLKTEIGHNRDHRGIVVQYSLFLHIKRKNGYHSVSVNHLAVLVHGKTAV